MAAAARRREISRFDSSLPTLSEYPLMTAVEFEAFVGASVLQERGGAGGGGGTGASSTIAGGAGGGGTTTGGGGGGGHGA